MRLLDLYCGAGGASMGYCRAGITDITGVDIAPQPRYPFRFVQGDAIEYLESMDDEYDIIHASPPCQRFSAMTKGLWKDRLNTHPDLIEDTRYLLVDSGKIYVIENVIGADLISPIMLCGSMFGLPLRRHRLFESNVFMLAPVCQHSTQDEVVGVYGHSGGSSRRDGKTFYSVDDWKRAMDIDWMVGSELAEAIPPAYTEWICRRLLTAMEDGV